MGRRSRLQGLYSSSPGHSTALPAVCSHPDSKPQTCRSSLCSSTTFLGCSREGHGPFSLEPQGLQTVVQLSSIESPWAPEPPTGGQHCSGTPILFPMVSFHSDIMAPCAVSSALSPSPTRRLSKKTRFAPLARVSSPAPRILGGDGHHFLHIWSSLSAEPYPE